MDTQLNWIFGNLQKAASLHDTIHYIQLELPNYTKDDKGGLKEARYQLFERVVTQLEKDRDELVDGALHQWKLWRENAKTNP